MDARKRIGVFGWGVVAPKSPDIAAFEQNLERADSWLSPFRGFGSSNFLVGYPEFDFETYHDWFDQRFPPAKFKQLKDKMGPMVLSCIGAFIQSLTQNRGIEEYLQSLGTKAHVYIGTGIGEITITANETIAYDRALRKWNEFWAMPERCAPLRAHTDGAHDPDAPQDPDEFTIGCEDWIDAKHAWEAFWAAKSDALLQYLAEAADIQSEPVPPQSGSAKLSTIRQKLNKVRALNKKWGCPDEPWASVSPNLLWNIANIPASQVSMIGRIVGPAFAPVAACASFGVALKMAVDAINLGEAKAVVVGMTDPPPHALVISAFYNANVLSADADVSRPLTALKGTHIAGGSCVWIVGDAAEMMAQGFRPLGMEIVGVGTSSDAHHIITPSKGGPQLAMKQAMENVRASDVTTWDMHATATPGDATERKSSRGVLSPAAPCAAGRGVWGRGWALGGAGELTPKERGLSGRRLSAFPLGAGARAADEKIFGKSTRLNSPPE